MSEFDWQTGGDRPSGLHEVRRKMRNSLALGRSIIRRSAEGADDVDSYALHLEGRLDVINRILSAVLGDPGARFDLRQLIADELHEQHVIGGHHACSLQGPEVALDPSAAEVLALLFHELVTNSIEHGALGIATAASCGCRGTSTRAAVSRCCGWTGPSGARPPCLRAKGSAPPSCNRCCTTSLTVRPRAASTPRGCGSG